MASARRPRGDRGLGSVNERSEDAFATGIGGPGIRAQRPRRCNRSPGRKRWHPGSAATAHRPGAGRSGGAARLSGVFLSQRHGARRTPSPPFSKQGFPGGPWRGDRANGMGNTCRTSSVTRACGRNGRDRGQGTRRGAPRGCGETRAKDRTSRGIPMGHFGRASRRRRPSDPPHGNPRRGKGPF